jgi:hypothetical protein
LDFFHPLLDVEPMPWGVFLVVGNWAAMDTHKAEVATWHPSVVRMHHLDKERNLH